MDRCFLLLSSQDMVVEFAKMNSYQLLEETEKAVSVMEGREAIFCYLVLQTL